MPRKVPRSRPPSPQGDTPEPGKVANHAGERTEGSCNFGFGQTPRSPIQRTNHRGRYTRPLRFGPADRGLFKVSRGSAMTPM